MFWSAVCLRCSADKCTYVICNQFIEQQFRGKLLAPARGGQRRCQYWPTVTLTAPQCSNCSAASCDTEGLKQTFGETMQVSRECKLPSHAGENLSACDSRRTCFYFHSKVTRHARSSSAHDLIPLRLALLPCNLFGVATWRGSYNRNGMEKSTHLYV